jgi:hypothetical protein
MSAQPASSLLVQDDERAGYPSASEYGRLFKCRASTEGVEILSDREREDWDSCQRKREEFIAGWSDGSPIESIKETWLWLRKGIKPLLSGKPDEILRQGTRMAIIDLKFGNRRVSDPSENSQLAIYSLLAARSDDAAVAALRFSALHLYPR